MSRVPYLVPLLAALLLGACAAAPTYGPSDDEALAPIRKAHQDCLQGRIGALINGSDDVSFLTRHIVEQCDDTLRPAADYLTKRGFGAYYVSQFVQQQRKIGADATANVILTIKARQNESGAM